jgi:hypothetical protein
VITIHWLLVSQPDVTSTEQMCIFAHDVTCESEVLEGLPTMQGQTKRPDSIQALLGSLQKNNLDPHKLVGTDIDVVISTIGSRIVWNIAFTSIRILSRVRVTIDRFLD